VQKKKYSKEDSKEGRVGFIALLDIPVVELCMKRCLDLRFSVRGCLVW
jgi:hypothetical protein